MNVNITDIRLGIKMLQAIFGTRINKGQATALLWYLENTNTPIDSNLLRAVTFYDSKHSLLVMANEGHEGEPLVWDDLVDTYETMGYRVLDCSPDKGVVVIEM